MILSQDKPNTSIFKHSIRHVWRIPNTIYNMAEVVYQNPVKEIRGTLTKNGPIHRRKYYRDDNGKIIGASKPEAYQILYPRNWKKKPATGKELEHQRHFTAACAETKRILMAAKPEKYPGYTPTPEELTTLQYWQNRFNAQLQKPEPEAPIDPETGKNKTYHRFDAFIRTCLLREMP